MKHPLKKLDETEIYIEPKYITIFHSELDGIYDQIKYFDCKMISVENNLTANTALKGCLLKSIQSVLYLPKL